jgi:hypothetical protein
LYRPGTLWVLSPQRKVARQLNPESAEPTLQKPDPADPGLREAIAYYQSASAMFRGRLNAWVEPASGTKVAHRHVSPND